MTFFDRHYPHWPPGVPKTLSVPRTSIYYNLEVSAARYPDRPAIVYYGSALTYRELQRDTLALAGHLQQRCGVRRGDRVLLYAQNSPQFIIGYYAILRANAVVVPVNPMNKSEELAHYISDSDARTAIAGQELYREVEPHLGKGRIEHCVLACYGDYVRASTDLKIPDVVSAPRFEAAGSGVAKWADVMASNLVPGAHEAGPDDLAVLPYTSGTTGLPKGCMLTHSNILATSTGACCWSSTSSESVVLGVLPMFHLTGMQSNMNIPIQLGATSVLMTRWDRDTAAELIQRHRVTGVTGITTMIVDLLANPNLGKYDLSSIHRIGGGGASMPQAVAAQVERTFGQPFLEGYGLTETAGALARQPGHRPKPQCGGIPYFDTDSRVVNPETLRECGPNEVGEIITNGPQVFRGYWKQPQATEAAFIEHDGKQFFRTGDLGYYDEEGLFLHHRPSEAHDQCVRLQGLARRGGSDALCAPGHPGSLRHRHARPAPRGDGESGRGAEIRGARPRTARRNRRLGERPHGCLQVPARRRIRRRAAENRDRQDLLAQAQEDEAKRNAA
jgi:fatty-acyl-CoA synthase